MIFVDSSVLIPVAVRTHSNHEYAAQSLTEASPATHATAAHCLTELYAFLSGRRHPRLVPPHLAADTVAVFATRFAVTALTAEETLKAVEQSARSGIAGGTIYDALILTCARKAKAQVILTYDVDDFQRIAPDLISIIREP